MSCTRSKWRLQAEDRCDAGGRAYCLPILPHLIRKPCNHSRSCELTKALLGPGSCSIPQHGKVLGALMYVEGLA